MQARIREESVHFRSDDEYSTRNSPPFYAHPVHSETFVLFEIFMEEIALCFSRPNMLNGGKL